MLAADKVHVAHLHPGETRLPTFVSNPLRLPKEKKTCGRRSEERFTFVQTHGPPSIHPYLTP